MGASRLPTGPNVCAGASAAGKLTTQARLAPPQADLPGSREIVPGIYIGGAQAAAQQVRAL